MCNLLGLLTWGDQSLTLGRITCGAMSLRGELYLGRRIPSDKSDVGRLVHKPLLLTMSMTYNLKTLLHQSLEILVQATLRCKISIHVQLVMLITSYGSLLF